MRYVRAFGAFWYDFLVGDRPELFVGSIVAIALMWALIQIGMAPGIAGWVLTVAILGVGAFGIATASRPKH